MGVHDVHQGLRVLLQRFPQRRLAGEPPRRHGLEAEVAHVIGLGHRREVLHVRQREAGEREAVPLPATAGRRRIPCLRGLVGEAHRVGKGHGHGAAVLTGEASRRCFPAASLQDRWRGQVRAGEGLVGEVHPQSLLRLHPVRGILPYSTCRAHHPVVAAAVLVARAGDRRQGHAAPAGTAGQPARLLLGDLLPLPALLDLGHLLRLGLRQDRLEALADGFRQGVVLAEQSLGHLVPCLEGRRRLVPLLEELSLHSERVVGERQNRVVVLRHTAL
mmetsp:Transcript_32325/g.94559  ORF Transcript_32325/g.94559 Transcript_32325/m.94559 type:complete len:274 (-) Transcript_32325:588-1409(-)